MFSRRSLQICLLFVFLLLSLIACQPQTIVETRVVEVVQTEEIEVPVEVTRVEVQTETVTEQVEVTVVVSEQVAPLGSEDRPIQVLFVPSTEVNAIVSGGELLAQELEAATGFKFEVSVPTSYAATIEAICASPDDTIAFLPALGYVLANERCGVQVGNAAVRFGWSVYWAQIVVRIDSGIETIEDLAGKTWGAPSVTSTSGFLVPSAMLYSAGIEPGEVVETGGHPAAMLAVANGDVDFGTAFFSPPLLPDRIWNPEVDSPEIWRDAGVPPVFADGRVYVNGTTEEGGYRILDARAAAMETYPTIFEETRILDISDEIPNDTVSFGAGFPFGMSREIIAALAEYAASDACINPPEGVVTLCSDSFYGWTGADPVDDADFDPIRVLIEALGMTDEDILGE